MCVSSHRFFIALFIYYIQALASFVFAELLLDEPWAFGYFFNGVLFEDWHSFLVFECICDLDFHFDWMVEVGLSFFQVDVVDFSLSVEIRLPLRIKLFG